MNYKFSYKTGERPEWIKLHLLARGKVSIPEPIDAWLEMFHLGEAEIQLYPTAIPLVTLLTRAPIDFIWGHGKAKWHQAQSSYASLSMSELSSNVMYIHTLH